MRNKEKFRSIRFKDLEKESLPSNRLLLRCSFEDNYGSLYKWTPAWKEIEKIFLEAVKIEEWNNPEGAWGRELREASKKIPSLRGFELPIKLKLRSLKDEGIWYKVRLDISFTEEDTETEEEKHGHYSQEFRVKNCEVNFLFLKRDILDRLEKVVGDKISGISIEDHCIYWDDGSVSFNIRLKKELKEEYSLIIRNVAEVIRLYIRKVLSDYENLKEGLFSP